MKDPDIYTPGDLSNPSTPGGVQHRLRRCHRFYTHEEVGALPRNRSGVYAIWLPATDKWNWGGLECIYIGKSERCIRRRLLDHLRPAEPNPQLRDLLGRYVELAQFSVAYTAYRSETDALETAAIQAFRPTANRNKRAPDDDYY